MPVWIQQDLGAAFARSWQAWAPTLEHVIPGCGHFHGQGSACRGPRGATRPPAKVSPGTPGGTGGGHAAQGDENQCRTLARMAEVERRRFGVKYTPAGMDLLHRIGWSV